MTEAPQVEAKHVAAAIYGERQAQSGNVQAVQQARRELGGQRMFQAVEAGEIQEEPDFGAVDRAVRIRSREADDLVQRQADPNITAAERAALQNQEQAVRQRVQRLQENRVILEEIHQGQQLTDATLQAVGRVLAQIPGFYTSLAGDLGMQPDQVKQSLENGQFLNDANLRATIEARVRDKTMRDQIAKFFNKEKYDENIDNLDAQVDELEQKIETDSQNITDKRQRSENARNWYGGLNPQEKQRLQGILNQYNQLSRIFANQQDPLLQLQTVDQQSIGNLRQIIAQQIQAQQNAIQQQLQNANPQLLGAFQALDQAAQQLEQLIGTADFTQRNLQGNRNAIEMLQDAQVADQKLNEVAQENKQLTKDRNQLANLRQQQKRALEKYENNVFGSLEKATKGYWNEDLLKKAIENAQFQAQQREGGEKEAKTREEKVKELVDRFFQLSVFRYDANGKVVGWDDAFIKDMAKNQLLQRSPAEMMKLFIQRVADMRPNLPLNYQEEINKLLTDIGVVENPPQGQNAVTVTDVLNGLDTKFLRDQATAYVPKLLGYAWARGYWSDRIRFNKVQTEFLRQAYTPDFFDKALSGKGEYQKLADSILGKGVLNLRGEVGNQIKKHITGKDWVDIGPLFKKLLLLLAALGLLGALGLGALKITGH